ncbi:MAG: hypothetical protein WCC57_02175, partial [Paracoccaceae bacterium]
NYFCGKWEWQAAIRGLYSDSLRRFCLKRWKAMVRRELILLWLIPVREEQTSRWFKVIDQGEPCAQGRGDRRY